MENWKTDLPKEGGVYFVTLSNGDVIVDRFTELGELIGLGVQLRDDIFDYYNDDVGKPTGNDIREGKITLPLIYALRKAPNHVSEKIMQIIQSRDYIEDNIDKILSFAKDYKGIDYAYKKMDLLLSEAEEIILDFKFDAEIIEYMMLFLSYLRNRSY